MARVKANGIEIEYDSHGNPADPAVVLIMGFSGQMIMWPMSFVEGLVKKGFRVIRFDNRDVGLTTHMDHLGPADMGAAMAAAATGRRPANAPYLLDDMAKDVVGLLDALGIKAAHIVGASMGGMIAQLVAVNHPEHTLSMTSIMSTTGRPGLTQARPEIMAVLVTPPRSDSKEDRAAAFKNTFRTIGSPGFPATDAELDALANGMVNRGPYNPAGIARQMVAIMASEPRHEKLAKVKAPSLVVHGKDDPLVPLDGGEDTARSIPNSELIVVPGMAHDFTEALMPQFIEHVGNFIGKVEARQKAA
jgi:pimeloyl-ACP methyl ester carboxylesterase